MAQNWWENDAVAGQAPSRPSGGMTIQTRPADPKLPFEVQRLQQQIGSTAADEARQAALTPAQLEALRLDNEKKRRDLAAQQATATPEQQKAQSNLANDEILFAIQRAKADLQNGGAAGYWARLPEMFQPQSALNLAGSLNTISSRLTLDKLAQLKQASPTGASGLGSLTEKEGSLLRDSVAALGQTQDPARLMENLNAVERHYRNIKALSDGFDYRDPKVAERYGIVTAMPKIGGGSSPMEVDPSGGNVGPNPALKGVNDEVRALLGAGHSVEEIRNYLRSKGVDDSQTQGLEAAAQFIRDNPSERGKPYRGDVSVDLMRTADPNTFGALSASPVGSYFGGGFNGFTAGLSDELAGSLSALTGGDYTQSRDAYNARKSLLSEANPTADMLGNITGGAMALAAPGTALSRFGIGGAAEASTLAPRLLAEDALYGGLYGAGENNDNRLWGGFRGALEGVGGGIAGRGVFRGVGASLRGARGQLADAARYLREQGIPLTPGQAAGGRLKTREDRLAGYQGIGDRIGEMRRGGLDAFNETAFRQNLAPVGEAIPPGVVGEEAVNATRGAVGRAYDAALGGRTFDVNDPQFVADLGRSLSDARGLPAIGDQAEYSIRRSIEPFVGPNDIMTGRGMQQASQELTRRGTRFGNSQDAVGPDAANTLTDALAALEGLVQRQSPGTVEAYRAANGAYRGGRVLEDAVGAARNAGLGTFTPAQLTNAAYSNARRFGGRQSTTDRPFFELSRAGQRVLPSTVPDSGTAGRASGPIRDAVRNAINAPLYSDAGRAAAEAFFLAQRPESVARVGDIMVNRARLPGLFGSVGAVQYYGQ
ncbi:hypothetical protein K7W03_14460 [Sphingobium sp. PNB]|uniref:hypothetical protein n=1 Tax=Sphingobium sp. PNB TaxID=863934 RepID=UPI001CA406AE|nr:hypothetical protein [Sphingobium sp. PNB]MCB4860794.1 hypothetical protein [Sphingobium sp. PNB]